MVKRGVGREAVIAIPCLWYSQVAAILLGERCDCVPVGEPPETLHDNQFEHEERIIPEMVPSSAVALFLEILQKRVPVDVIQILANRHLIRKQIL